MCKNWRTAPSPLYVPEPLYEEPLYDTAPFDKPAPAFASEPALVPEAQDPSEEDHGDPMDLSATSRTPFMISATSIAAIQP